MPAYKYNWSLFTGSGIMATLAGISGIRPAKKIASLKYLLTNIYTNVGGLPLIYKKPAKKEILALSKIYLYDALKHFTSYQLKQIEVPLVYSKKTKIKQLSSTVHSFRLLKINSAPSGQLKNYSGLFTKPEIQEILFERSLYGSFLDLKDLKKRIKSISLGKLELLKNFLLFDKPSDFIQEPFRISGRFETDFLYWLSKERGSAFEKLETLLTKIAICAANKKHPYNRHLYIRKPSNVILPIRKNTDWIGLLAGSSYYYEVINQIGQAKKSLEIVMFHIVLPGDDHPTRKIIDEIIKVHKQGVSVRVLIDQDQETDPYHSTIINSPVKNYLNENGIECRFDKSDKLLHSKFLIIDDSISIIGSHNWSAGSYFQFDDFSLVINSLAFTKKMKKRFEKLWKDT